MSRASDEIVDALTEFGERIGIAFQLSDDILDIASSAGDSGKTPGTDLREGVPTLPVILARRSSDPDDAELVRLLSGPITDDVEVTRALDALRVHPAMAEARGVVQAEADAARALLGKLPDVPARAALEAICDTVATRLT
jgi:heptaprenyl diphosphate synthase